MRTRGHVTAACASLLCGALLLLTVVATAAILNWDSVSRVLSDPAGLTGRAEIWQAILAYMRDHPLLGAGFGTIAHTGALSPLHNYTNARWVEAIADSHRRSWLARIVAAEVRSANRSI